MAALHFYYDTRYTILFVTLVQINGYLIKYDLSFQNICQMQFYFLKSLLCFNWSVVWAKTSFIIISLLNTRSITECDKTITSAELLARLVPCSRAQVSLQLHPHTMVAALWHNSQLTILPYSVAASLSRPADLYGTASNSWPLYWPIVSTPYSSFRRENKL